ncbi:WXG100 family type VII secretion target [Brachybacterium sacelli]|uniref:WXG100 family type VII secretion target n=1 Tax=Brachybacterium sacelli TaxID=173364 RepID=A0ABS4WYA0_9MICO|nr:WXG100 family type VII secretion target [Brachybacterium sacelli]MBP2381179.1 WXG100 family type VII secretion target [Brachybacterium sacelli]
MTGFYGGDTEQMIDLYREFHRKSNAIQSVINGIQWDLQMLQDQWKGEDFESFNATFWDGIRPQAKETFDAIETMGRELREHTEEQDDASSADDGLLKTLKDIYSNGKAALSIIAKTAEKLWEGIKSGKIDWKALRDGADQLTDWWQKSGIADDLGRLVKSKGFKRIAKLIPIVDIPLGLHDMVTAKDPIEFVTALGGLVGSVPHPSAAIFGAMCDVAGIADWVGEEFFDYDLSREVWDGLSDAADDWADGKTWGPGLYPWAGV